MRPAQALRMLIAWTLPVVQDEIALNEGVKLLREAKMGHSQRGEIAKRSWVQCEGRRRISDRWPDARTAPGVFAGPAASHEVAGCFG